MVKQQLKFAYEDYILSSETSIIEDNQKFCVFVYTRTEKSQIPSKVMYNESTYDNPQDVVNVYAH